MAAVTVREDRPGDQRLVCYVSAKNSALTIREVNLHLSGKLPRYMLPNLLVHLDQFPLTGSGKIDRKNLPVPELGTVKDKEAVELNPMESIVASLWTELTGKTDISPEDNFFSIGGHSLAGLKFIATLEEKHGVKIKIRDLMTGNLRNIAEQLNKVPQKNSESHQNKLWKKLFRRL